jgi:hypothetical protein
MVSLEITFSNTQAHNNNEEKKNEINSNRDQLPLYLTRTEYDSTRNCISRIKLLKWKRKFGTQINNKPSTKRSLIQL